MARYFPNIEVTRVLASATVVGGAATDSSLVDCQGAKAVHFVVRSTTAGETDAFTEPDIIGKVATDAGATNVVTSPASSNALGVLTVNASACVTAGNQGYVLTVLPDMPGTDAGATNPRAVFGCAQIGIRINPHATNDISTVVADAIVVWD